MAGQFEEQAVQAGGTAGTLAGAIAGARLGKAVVNGGMAFVETLTNSTT